MFHRAIELEAEGMAVESLKAFQEWYAKCSGEIAARHQVHLDLQQRLLPEGSATLPGWCASCERESQFTYDWLYGAPGRVNWRERLVCAGCGLNNRLRLSVDAIRRLAPGAASEIYLTEQVTPLARLLAQRYPGLVTSEFLGDEWAPGAARSDGVRHQDLTRLSLDPGRFDLVASFDVLEHIPDFKQALAEMRRVLRPGGHLLLSAPMNLRLHHHHLRARVLPDGQIEHLSEPEYHGDPVNPDGGVLCYQHFGWRLLDDCREAGFREATLRLHWSLRRAHIGFEQPLLVAVA